MNRFNFSSIFNGLPLIYAQLLPKGTKINNIDVNKS